MTHVQDKEPFMLPKNLRNCFLCLKKMRQILKKLDLRWSLMTFSHLNMMPPKVHLIKNHLCLLPPRLIIMKFYQFLNELKTWREYHDLDSNATQETQKKNQQRKPLAWKQQRLHETSLHKHWLDQWNFTWKLYRSWTLGSI
jgi:hypothetical protein